MKRKQFTPEQIVAILREAETGAQTVAELCRKHGIPHLRWVQVSMKSPSTVGAGAIKA